MAVSSLLSPEKIARSPRGTIQDAQNFISGGSPIGSSVVQSATNKIVGFQRAEVRPVTPDINSIISSITNNVLSSVDNSIKSATQIINNNVDNKITNVTERLSNEIQNVRTSGPVTQLQNIVQVVQNKINQSIQKVIGDFSNDYAQKIKNIEENKPSQVLDKFLKVYRNALEFIQFFGNQKNVDRLKSNLVALKNSFNESFEVAKLVRQVIVKIVNQLSNLPRATPSGGGLNLDVNVPGSPLKKAGAPAMKGMGRGKMLGLGALGLGAAGLGGGAVVNALADSEQVQPQQVQTDIPQNLVDRFGAVVDRFSNILDSLIGKKKEENITVSSPGSSSPAAPKTKPSGSQGSPGVQIKDDAQGLAELGLSQKEWDVYKQGIADVEGAAYTQMGGAGGRFAGRYQMGDEAITEAAKVLGIPKPSRQEFLNNPQLQEKMYMGYTISNFRYMQSLSPEFKNMSREQQLAVLPMAQLGIGNLAQQLRTGKISKDAWGTPTTKFSEAVKRRQKEAGLKPFGKNIPSADAIKSPQVSVSPAQTQVAQQRATSVSQPPPTQVASSVNVLPIDMSSAQSQSGGGGGGQVISTPPSQKNGPSIPMLPSSNPDNFLVLYSKIVYNVVDG